MSDILTATQKALKLNLDPHIYGTFAEIGAGQEVANNFFKAGAASGTVAKSISAYDMIFSDSIYGKEKSKRYVCKSRLIKMLSYEYDLLLERLGETRTESKFFAFANTVSARNFQGTNEQHGWLGLKFRHEFASDASQIILHTKMHDNTNLRQQEALGVLGVNLIFTAFYKHDSSVEEFVNSLMENLSSEQIEIDMISCHGPAFSSIDERLLNLQLVKSEITDSVVFNTKGEVSLASDELYKKNVLIARGSYRPPTNVNIDLLNCGEETFNKDIGKDESIVTLAEITISQLQNDGSVSNEDFLARVDLLASLGQMVMVSSFKQYYRLTSFLTTFKPKNIAIVLGIYNFMQIFDNEYNLATGKTLEAIGMLLGEKVRIYLYPYKEEEKTDAIVDLNCVKVRAKHKPLLEFIKQSGEVKDLENYDDKMLHIFSRKVLDMIVANEEGWEDYVPPIVAKTIKEKCLFGKPC